MNKKVLAIYYTQSGQLEEIIDKFTAPFTEAGITVEKLRVQPVDKFPFPWTSERFFDAMPESVLGIPVPLEPLKFRENSYDLIVFGYQPWFLSPSIPATSLLHDASFRKIVQDTPVITVIGARNMWLNSQEKLKKLLKDAGAVLTGNMVLIDKHNNHVSVVTILYWMLTGKKDRYLNIFPRPGVSDRDIAEARDFGEIALRHFQQEQLPTLQKEFIEKKAVTVSTNLMFVEERAGKLFSIWANLVKKKKNRKSWLVLFKYYLLIALFIVAPLILAVYTLLFRPFLSRSINKKKQYYLELN
jgi:hypothetical protein